MNINATTVFSDLRAAAQADSRIPFAATAAGVILLGSLSFLLRPVVQTDDSGIVKLPGWLSSLTAWSFFAKRHDFLFNGFAKTGQELFQFRFLQHTVVAVSGEEGRKVFHNDKYLDFTQGYQILLGGAPRLEQSSEAEWQPENMTWFNKNVAILFSKERLADVLPSLLDDINGSIMRTMPDREGRIDPFRNVYDLIVQMTIRMVSCRSLSNDPAAVAEMWNYFDIIEKSATPFSLILPWIPTSTTRNKEKATTELYKFLAKYIEERRNSTPSADAFDVLIASGLDNKAIVGFAMIIIFAGITNSSVNACWILIYLASHPEWKARATKEVHDLISNHSNPVFSKEPLHKRLASIPINAWESEMPVIELCLKETLRLTATGAALRRNTKADLPMAGKIVKRGWFLAYSAADVHLNPNIYTNPDDWDPSRFEPGREEDKKEAYAFIAWGGGRHPCSGMKFAKLEIKMIVSLFLAGYEYELVDAKGNYPKQLPIPDINDLQRASPMGDPFFLKYKRVED
ncbi:cytochrome P450 [Pholiota conissans]|uniref:Cytochrome P450 n=1 Tax=Pholiota conissans TaxID=109636 RepID=A0A9P5Z038_9AGAR|nr:cytochrome P450 [Pholiota conissans]